MATSSHIGEEIRSTKAYPEMQIKAKMRRIETTSLPIGIADLPVTLADAKSHIRVRGSLTKGDGEIEEYIEAATRKVEDYTGRRYTDRSFDLIFDCEDIDSNIIILEPFNDVIIVNTFDSTDETHNETAVPAAAFTLVGRRIQLEDAFGDLELRKIDSIAIQYDVAKVTASESVKLAIKIIVAHVYEFRGSQSLSTIISQVPDSYLTHLQEDRVMVI